MITVVFGLFAVLTIEVWLWAMFYVIIGALPDISTALYLSTGTFSTLGFGDVLPPKDGDCLLHWKPSMASY